jgi:hypothetical protein
MFYLLKVTQYNRIILFKYKLFFDFFVRSNCYDSNIFSRLSQLVIIEFRIIQYKGTKK